MISCYFCESPAHQSYGCNIVPKSILAVFPTRLADIYKTKKINLCKFCYDKHSQSTFKLSIIPLCNVFGIDHAKYNRKNTLCTNSQKILFLNKKIADEKIVIDTMKSMKSTKLTGLFYRKLSNSLTNAEKDLAETIKQRATCYNILWQELQKPFTDEDIEKFAKYKCVSISDHIKNCMKESKNSKDLAAYIFNVLNLYYSDIKEICDSLSQYDSDNDNEYIHESLSQCDSEDNAETNEAVNEGANEGVSSLTCSQCDNDNDVVFFEELFGNNYYDGNCIDDNQIDKHENVKPCNLSEDFKPYNPYKRIRLN